MPQRYINYLSNVSSNALLKAYGIIKPEETVDKLQSVTCPNCNEPNKVNSRFCAKCKMVLTYDAWQEIKELDMDYLPKLMKRIEELEKMTRRLVTRVREDKESGRLVVLDR